MAPKKKKPVAPAPLTAQEIRDIRVGLNLTQAQAAEKVGVSRRSWAGWEGGEATPSGSAAILIRLLKAGKI